jgi:hypothetical protein
MQSCFRFILEPVAQPRMQPSASKLKTSKLLVNPKPKTVIGCKKIDEIIWWTQSRSID